MVVDDDRDLCKLVTQYLEPEGSGFLLFTPRAMMLPDIKGFEVLGKIRMHVHTPVLMFTAKGTN